MKDLEEDLQNCNERISKRREAVENVKNYRLCDEFTEEISSLHREKHQMVAKLDLLNRKEKQSKNYLRRKKSSSTSSVSPQSSRNSTPCPVSDSDQVFDASSSDHCQIPSTNPTTSALDSNRVASGSEEDF